MQFGFEQCPYCGNTGGFIYVHSHYQCVRCGNNVMPCCSGEQDCSVEEQTDKNEDTTTKAK